MTAGDLRIVDEFWAQLCAVDDRAAARARAHEARRQLARTLAIAIIALLAAAAVALAAKALLTGSAAPRRYPPTVVNIGAVKPGTAHLLSIREPDPDSGPPWGVRIFKTTRGERVCSQVGRVFGGRLVALGVAGDFQDDGRVHPLPLEASGCTQLTRTGHLRFTMLAPAPTTSGLAVQVGIPSGGCLTPDSRQVLANEPAKLRRYVVAMHARGDVAAESLGRRRLQAALQRLRHVPLPCAPGDLRAVIFGFAGANATSVTLTRGGRGISHRTLGAEEGAFLYVLHGRPPLRLGSLVARYRDGLECPVANPLRPASRAPVSAACLRHRNG
jgi:hypothetical protein